MTSPLKKMVSTCVYKLLKEDNKVMMITNDKTYKRILVKLKTKQILHPKVGHSQIEILKPILRNVKPSWLISLPLISLAIAISDLPGRLLLTVEAAKFSVD